MFFHSESFCPPKSATRNIFILLPLPHVLPRAFDLGVFAVTATYGVLGGVAVALTMVPSLLIPLTSLRIGERWGRMYRAIWYSNAKICMSDRSHKTPYWPINYLHLLNMNQPQSVRSHRTSSLHPNLWVVFLH